MLLKIKNQILPIAVAAGEAIMDIYNNEEDFNIEHKNDNSPLTKADKKANDIICSGLNKLKDLFPIISEENKQIPYDDRKDYDFCWLVDPLDGTKEFIKRNGEFTVNIALINRNEIVLGVVYTPASKELFWAVKGQGAFSIINNKEEKLTAPSFTMNDVGLRVVCSRSHLNEETQKFVDNLKSPELVSKGSSLKFLCIAKGEAELYPRIAPTMEWDTGAAQIILEEAGGSVVQFENRESVCYNKENLLNPYFIAAGTIVK